MDRIGPAGGSPTVALTDGAQGFVDENLASGQEGTLVPAAFMNAVQEELMSILAAAGTTPNIATFNQVLTSLNTLFLGASSLALHGWQRLPSGLIVQWLSGTLPTGNADAVVLPTAFPNAYYVAVACEADAGGWSTPPTATVYGVTPDSLSAVLVSGVRFTGGSFSYAATTYNLIALGR